MSQTPVKEVVLHLPRGHLRHISYIIAERWAKAKDGVCFITFNVAEIKGSSVFFSLNKITTSANSNLQNIAKKSYKSEAKLDLKASEPS